MTRWLIAFALTWALAAQASAHGRPPFIGEIALHPTDPDTIVVRGTFGLVVSHDHGESWYWICAAITGADPVREDPPILVMPDGSILVATFSGLSLGRPDHCEWTYPEALLTDVFVIDIQRGVDPSTVYAVLTDGFDPDQLYRSTDAGESFVAVGLPVEDILLERVRVAPSDEDRIYLSGAIPLSAGVTEREGYLLRSSDRGETFEAIQIPLEDGERNVHLFAVDPTDADRVLIRITRRVTDMRDERLVLTEDGGDTFETVLTGRDLTAASFTADGGTVFATSHHLAGLFVSADGGRSFTNVVEGSFYDVVVRSAGAGTELFVAADELRDPYSLGRSLDSGATIEPLLSFAEIGAMPDCPRCSGVGYVCPEWFPDLATDLRLDVEVRVDGGVTGAPRDAGAPSFCTDGGLTPMDGGPGPTTGGGCGCRATRDHDVLPFPALALVGLAIGARRLTRRRPRPYVGRRRVPR